MKAADAAKILGRHVTHIRECCLAEGLKKNGRSFDIPEEVVEKWKIALPDVRTFRGRRRKRKKYDKLDGPPLRRNVTDFLTTDRRAEILEARKLRKIRLLEALQNVQSEDATLPTSEGGYQEAP